MVFADWPLLPPELLSCIADCFLATSDIDYYMDFRAVCRSWPSSTEDPKNSAHPRFRPRHWVFTDMVFRTGPCLLVNTATGRFLRKELPVLRNYFVTDATLDGLLLLMQQDSPYAVHVLNPFTGYMIRFIVTLPDGGTLEFPTLVSDPSTTLVLLCNKSLMAYLDDPDFLFRNLPRQVYKADPGSECFVVYEDSLACPLTRLTDRGICANGELEPAAPYPVAVAQLIFGLAKHFNADPVELSDEEDTLMSQEEAMWNFYIGCDNRCFLVESAGELLIIIKIKKGVEVFKMDTERYVIEHVENIGNRAIFLGEYKCMAVAADKFPSIGANCIYYAKSLDLSSDMYKYNLKCGREERISEVMYGREEETSGPCTIIEFLLFRTLGFCRY